MATLEISLLRIITSQWDKNISANNLELRLTAENSTYDE